ncbi:MAG: leucine-rich repeat domain-containing protein [Bacteroidales bacterium]|nr:leucine-rich repeat domain-containing protein [Bacteroidales bacterium]
MQVILNHPPFDEIHSFCWYSHDYKHLKKCFDTSISHLEIHEKCEIIEANAFDGCHNLTKIALPANVCEIGESAFANCDSLRKITGTEHLKKIGNHAFYHCIQLHAFYISDKITTIEPYTFYDCRGLKEVGDLTKVTSIGDAAFCNCMTLDTIKLPECLIYCGNKPFDGCENLSEEAKRIIEQWEQDKNQSNK